MATILEKAPRPERHPAHAGIAPPLLARPLYLLAAADTVVDLDGPSLMVRSRRRAPTRYPFVRVSRIVSGISVQWKGRALTECIARRIPVVFLERDGTPAGYLQPASRALSTPGGLLEELLSRPDWCEHHANWLRSERRRVVGEYRDAREAEGNALSETEYKELVRSHVYSTTASGACTGFYRGALAALVGEYVCKCGFRHAYTGFGGGTLDLLTDLTDLLELSLDLELRGLGSSAHADVAAQLRVFQVFADRLARRCVGMLGRLQRRVAEILHAWH